MLITFVKMRNNRSSESLKDQRGGLRREGSVTTKHSNHLKCERVCLERVCGRTHDVCICSVS